MSAIKQQSIKIIKKELEQRFANYIAATNKECFDYSCRILTRVKNKLKKMKDHNIDRTIKTALGAQATL